MTGLPGKNVPIYPIGSVEKLTGLTARQIRYYESKGLVEPARTEGNQRLYSQAQVERLLTVKRLMAEGYNLKSIKEYFASEEQPESLLESLEDLPAEPRLDRKGLRSLYPVKDHPRLMRLLGRRAGEREDGW